MTTKERLALHRAATAEVADEAQLLCRQMDVMLEKAAMLKLQLTMRGVKVTTPIPLDATKETRLRIGRLDEIANK